MVWNNRFVSLNLYESFISFNIRPNCQMNPYYLLKETTVRYFSQLWNPLTPHFNFIFTFLRYRTWTFKALHNNKQMLSPTYKYYFKNCIMNSSSSFEFLFFLFEATNYLLMTFDCNKFFMPLTLTAFSSAL